MLRSPRLAAAASAAAEVFTGRARRENGHVTGVITEVNAADVPRLELARAFQPRWSALPRSVRQHASSFSTRSTISKSA